MIQLPNEGDFRRGLSRVPTDESRGVRVDSGKISLRVRSIANLPRLLPKPSEANVVVGAAQAVVATCAELRLRTPAGSARWAIETMWSWLDGTSWVLALDPTAEADLASRMAAAGPTFDTDEFLEVAGNWLGPRLVHRVSGRLANGAMYDASGATKLMFIATRVSNIDSDEDRANAAHHSQTTADLAYSVGGFRCHQTSILADPALETSHHPGWREQDEDVVAIADVVAIIWDAPADGFGVIVEMARQYGVPVVIIKVGPGRLSPMLLGAEGRRPTVLPLEAYAEELREILQKDRLGLDASQRARRKADRAAAAELEDLRAAFEALTPEQLSDPRLGGEFTQLAPERFRRLINRPTLWRGATAREQSLVRRLTRWAPPLAYEEARALSRVQDALLLDSQTALRLEHEGRREKAFASAGKARFDATKPEAWLDLLKKLDDER